jgi:hypothetical protein
MENSTQKVCKISVSSSDFDSLSSGAESDEMEYERTPQQSKILRDDYSEIIGLLTSTLSSTGYDDDTSEPNLATLTSLVSVICTEFLKNTHIRPDDSDVFQKLLSDKQEAVEFTSQDCFFLLQLIKSLLKDANYSRFNSKVHELEVENVKSAKIIRELRNELKQKMSLLKKLKKSGGKKTHKLQESQSTLNESEDMFCIQNFH